MKQEKFLEDYKKIADIQASRLNYSLNRVQKISPLDSAKLESLSDGEVAFLDMLVTRFSKLQDVIGSKIFPTLLRALAEDSPSASFIDKLNKLEKLGFLLDANWWINIREIRNKVSHDYPDDYITLSKDLNELMLLARELLDFWEVLKDKIKDIRSFKT